MIITKRSNLLGLFTSSNKKFDLNQGHLELHAHSLVLFDASLFARSTSEQLPLECEVI